ncbi:Ubiquitin carboxyl-terminal hydrolase 19 [Balamuthia mandrillaris]
MYFKDKNTREVALERDALRTTGYMPQQVFPGSSHYAYPGGSAVPYSWMVAKCGHCGKSKAQADLKRCPCHQTTYCNQQCQKADWSKHKLTCSARKQPQGTASSSTSTTAKASSK